MSTIDEAAELFTSFFDAECKALEASLGGAASFDELHAEMQSMLSDDTVFKVPRVDVSKLTGDWKTANENTRSSLAPRQLFAVEQHDLGKRRLYCAIASAPHRRKIMGYEMKFWADDSLKIIASYFSCASCDGVGKIDTSKCSDCRGRGWQYSTGDMIKSTKPSAVKKLQRPTRAKSAAQYDQL
jgi:hypothetical protein